MNRTPRKMNASSRKAARQRPAATAARERLSSVDAYIAAAPRDARSKLRQFRSIIKEVAPEARESISYKMPYYEYKGRLAWFALGKTYIGLYLRPPIVEEHRKELAGFVTTKSAVHFPLEKEIPVSLVRRLVKSRVQKNLAEHQA